MPYKSHRGAQEACWKYWSPKKNKLTDEEVEEGYLQDRKVRFKQRNRNIIRKRKEIDNFTCQVCGFRLEINGKFIIDCHHTNPLSGSSTTTKTHIDDLICMCPTCHRISHTRKFPLTIEEIKVFLT